MSHVVILMGAYINVKIVKFSETMLLHSINIWIKVQLFPLQLKAIKSIYLLSKNILFNDVHSKKGLLEPTAKE